LVRVLEVFGRREETLGVNPSSLSLLTKRELEILSYLASELPLSKISSDLNITKNTMKTHLRHLYRKLGATDRRDAVEKGKALLNL
jgi:ATP/maltotriose-dependent transcriptional regulator MalT